MQKAINCRTDANWLSLAVECVQDVGYAVVENVLNAQFVDITRSALYNTQASLLKEIGESALVNAGEVGVLRFMMRYDPHFFKFLEIEELLAIVDATVSDTAVLHLQNGFILPTHSAGADVRVFQTQFHMDFRRVLNGYLASINVFFALDGFNSNNGATLVVPGSQQRPLAPSVEYMQRVAVPVICPPGSMIVFDSTLWHAAGQNVSGADRLAINHQFTRSFFKQQVDYVRALEERIVESLPPRSQQLLGWYTRLPASPGQYYVSPPERLYRAGQG